MHAQEKPFLQFLEGVDKKFVIPVYQRNYDWRREHCEQLYNDLLDKTKGRFVCLVLINRKCIRLIKSAEPGLVI